MDGRRGAAFECGSRGCANALGPDLSPAPSPFSLHPATMMSTSNFVADGLRRYILDLHVHVC